MEFDEETLGKLIAGLIRDVMGKKAEFSIQVNREIRAIRIIARDSKLLN